MTDSNRLWALTLTDLLNFRPPFDARLSPDGTRVAFVRGETNKADKDASFRSAIYLVDAAGGEPRQFIGSGQTDDHTPRWSPDGTRLAFISNRADKDEAQLYTIRLDGGESTKLTDIRGGVGAPDWFADGIRIAFLARGSMDKDKPKPPDPQVEDADPHFNRVWLADTLSGDVRPVTPADLNVYEYAVSPDGAHLALLAGPHATSESWYTAQLYVTEIASGQTRQLCTITAQIGGLCWSPDGGQIAFISGVMSDEGAIGGDIFSVPAASGEPRNLTPDLDHTPTWIGWHARGIVYGARHLENTRLDWLDPANGTRTPIWIGQGTIGGFRQAISLSADGSTFAATFTSSDQPSNLISGSTAGVEWRQITDLFPELGGVIKPRVTSEQWIAPDGTPVQGLLQYPHDYDPARAYPLLVIAHGGPSSSESAVYGLGAWAWRHLVAGRGAFVLMPNPRGSWGRGAAYQAANVGDLGGGDWGDINAGVDHLIGCGLVDPARLAITGWSYGGYLTAWAVTQTERFRCAIAGAAITNYESNYGLASIRGWQTALFGANYHDDSDRQRARSPLTFANRVKTPTLILHGERDHDVPPEQSREFYYALKHFGVPTQLVIYPREPHGPTERAHQQDVVERIMAWLERYLFAP